MARNTKKKLAIFVGTSKCLIHAEAKFCASEMSGELKYYECARTEYCCGIGCCVSPALHFHHLWYYWILVIIMFLVCSGGGWWYRYWLQGRYRSAASAIPSRATTARAQNPLRGPACQGQRARITYNSARNTVLLHRMWKGPHRNGAVPAYNGNATTSTHYQNMSVVLNDANCPYYQLYGPPPSYETVIAQTRGKISNPASPESSSARVNAQSPQCFSYACSPSARLNGGLNGGLETSAAYQNGTASPRQLDNPEAIPFTRFPQYCVTDPTAAAAIRQNVCVPFNYQGQSFVPADNFSRIYEGASTAAYAPYPMDKSSDSSDPENQGYDVAGMERYMMLGMDCTAAGSSREWESSDRPMPRLVEKDETEVARSIESKSTVDSSEDLERPEFSRSRRVYGGSLKATGRYAGKEKDEEYTVQRAFSKTLPHSCDGLINTDPVQALGPAAAESPLDPATNDGANSFQSNPSNNVILGSFVSEGATSSPENVGTEAKRRSRIANASTNSDLESKHRLDRSKSLD